MIPHGTPLYSKAPLKKMVVIAGLSAAILLDLRSFASAQSNPSAKPVETDGLGPAHSAAQLPMRAPIGHFQPEPRDLPPGLLDGNISRTQQQIDFDKNLRICRGC
jgi:hypothetical protein